MYYHTSEFDDFYLDERSNFMHIDDVNEQYISRKEVENKFYTEQDIEYGFVPKEKVEELLNKIQTLQEEIRSWQTK